MTSRPADLSTLDAFDEPDLRRWLAGWLCAERHNLCEDTLRPLTPDDYNRAFDLLEEAMGRLNHRLSKLSAAKQFRAVQQAAKKSGLNISLDDALNKLRRYLISTPPQPPRKPIKPKRLEDLPRWRADLPNWKHNVMEWPLRRKALLASPWFAERAQHARAVEKLGHDLCARHYQDPDCRLALRCVMSVFSALEIWHSPSGPSQDERHDQRDLFYAVRRLCPANTKDGPRTLARFLVAVLRSKEDWPRVPAGMFFDLWQHFNVRRRLDFICKYHQLPDKKLTDEAKCHQWILGAVVCNNDLRSALARLAYDAEHRKKGWPRLCSTLADALTYITRKRSTSAKLRDFERDFAPELLGNTTQKQREAWGLDCKSDRGTRPLTRKEHLVLANNVRIDVARDGSGKSSADTLIARALEAVRREIKSA